MFTITYMTKQERQTKSIVVRYFQVFTDNLRVNMCVRHADGTYQTISDLVSWGLSSYPEEY